MVKYILKKKERKQKLKKNTFINNYKDRYSTTQRFLTVPKKTPEEYTLTICANVQYV